MTDIPVKGFLDARPPHPPHLTALVEKKDKTRWGRLHIIERQRWLADQLVHMRKVVDALPRPLHPCLGLDHFEGGGTSAKLVLLRGRESSYHTSRAEEERRTAKVLQGLLALEVESRIDWVIRESRFREDAIPGDKDLLNCVQGESL